MRTIRQDSSLWVCPHCRQRDRPKHSTSSCGYMVCSACAKRPCPLGRSARRWPDPDEAIGTLHETEHLGHADLGTMGRSKNMPELWEIHPNYTVLADVLHEALQQAQAGKGMERHSCGEPFEDQQIVVLNEKLGSIHGQVFQACKKSIEATRLETPHARRELLGAINYLAAAVIQLDRANAETGVK